jgi:hypothetical protein
MKTAPVHPKPGASRGGPSETQQYAAVVSLSI